MKFRSYCTIRYKTLQRKFAFINIAGKIVSPPPVFPLYRGGQALRLRRFASPLRVTWRAASSCTTHPPVSSALFCVATAAGLPITRWRWSVCCGAGSLAGFGWRWRFGSAIGDRGGAVIGGARSIALGTAYCYGCLACWWWPRFALYCRSHWAG